MEPRAFLATAERFGLIGGIDRWVTQQAVRLIEAHKREGRDLILEVNLSGRTIGDERFPGDVKRQLANAGIDPALLIFEVTETATVADIDQARSFAKQPGARSAAASRSTTSAPASAPSTTSSTCRSAT